MSFRYGYTGRERDLESGLDYYRARYYDAANGVFISVDPMGFGAGDTNLYRYVGNSSTLATDPSGNVSLYPYVSNNSTDAIVPTATQWRLPSLEEVGQGLRDFGRSWDNATHFWSRELVQPIANSLSSATQNGVNSYIDIVRDGQQRGGVIGTLEQGVGYFGGTIYSVPGAISDTVGGFVKAHPVLVTRIGGLVRAGVGVLEFVGGAATSAVGVGILPAVKGVDDFQTGIRQLFTGQDTKSLIHGAVENLTGSSNLAGFVDAGTGLAANAVAYNSLKAAKLAAESRAALNRPMFQPDLIRGDTLASDEFLQSMRASLVVQKSIFLNKKMK